MEFKTTLKVQCYDVICTGEIRALEENKPLANMLRSIDEKGMRTFLDDEKLKSFAYGLRENFQREELLQGDRLSPYGRRVAETQKVWKSLLGQFKFSVVLSEQQSYIYDFVPNYTGDVSGYREQKGGGFTGKFSNNYGMDIEIIGTDSFSYINAPQMQDLEVTYNYENEACRYMLQVGNKRFEFKDAQGFCLIDKYQAIEHLQKAVVNYAVLKVSNNTVILDSYSESNQLVKAAIEETFRKKNFSISEDEFEISGIRLDIKKPILAREILNKYLLLEAEKNYCGTSEVAVLVSEFYSLFRNCVDIGQDSRSLFEGLLSEAKVKNNTAYRRLYAYRDLVPEAVKIVPRADIFDFSNQQKSVKQISQELLGGGSIKSVSMLTKFAYKNARISRTIYFLGKSIKDIFGVPLTLITCNDASFEQSPVAKKWFDILSQSPTCISYKAKDKKSIERIHDRYYKIERTDGSVEWLKMSGELDAIRYDGDFADGQTERDDISENEVGSVKEMTITRIKYENINAEVRVAMEGK